jgi:hypothetical protein
MDNQLGEVTREVRMQVFHESHDRIHRFLVADIGEDNIILGYPFFEVANPMVNWPTGKVHELLTMAKIQPPSKNCPSWARQVMTSLKKTTIIQQLMEQATDKKEQTWEELVPKQYHKFGSIFSEKDSERFSGPRK